ncbi:hypothetical protein AMK06_CH02020 [Rhizobium sp. N541]|uniref:hypothetical protein n=1 Tax=unclassified Rhizobium TaxID=2613769 RepID=UPI0007EE522E|nr:MULTISPECIES: hypothetical protein [unclassified Rhizobium]ANM16920.1 hypothetical protein AMK06_CH02020 [Rhizobium sp. N541]ANM23305.1 hypothetical protein AMK07_CH02017 [Rhizobium sp. N941]
MTMTAFNPATTAAALKRFAEANMRPSLRQQISSPEVWSVIEEMARQGFTVKMIARGLKAVGIDGAELTCMNYISTIRKEKEIAEEGAAA